LSDDITANVADPKFKTKQNTEPNSPTFLHLNKTAVDKGKPSNENFKTKKIANTNINTSVTSPEREIKLEIKKIQDSIDVTQKERISSNDKDINLLLLQSILKKEEQVIKYQEQVIKYQDRLALKEAQLIARKEEERKRLQVLGISSFFFPLFFISFPLFFFKLKKFQ
jgi:hypothetical protein